MGHIKWTPVYYSILFAVEICKNFAQCFVIPRVFPKKEDPEITGIFMDW